MIKYVGIAIVLILVAVGGFATMKKISPVSWGWWGTTNTESGVALRGYDPVAYFEQETPVLGSDELTHEWGDATWHFASVENQQRFSANSEQYAPQFGGFCAFAASKGFTADPDPEAWHIEDGKLYVFADLKVRDEWVSGLAEGSLVRSQENWVKR